LGLCTIDQPLKNKFKELNIPTIKKIKEHVIEPTLNHSFFEKKSTIAPLQLLYFECFQKPKIRGVFDFEHYLKQRIGGYNKLK
jgi:hypothetical protein